MSSYPNNYVKDLSLQIAGLSEQRDVAVCLVDAKHTVVSCRDEQHTNHRPVTAGSALKKSLA